jgi:transposase
MKIENIDIEASIAKAQNLVREDKVLSAATKSIVEILIITLLANCLNLNSANRSKPPSSDPNRKKRRNTGNKVGGQKGHVGVTLKQVDQPDSVKFINIDRRKLPAGKYRRIGVERRQVFDLDISRIVIEYRAQILANKNGKQFVASFPDAVTKAVQYGTGVKAQSVYMSPCQRIPYDRIQNYFADQLHLPVSAGSVFNFNEEAFELLAGFENRGSS